MSNNQVTLLIFLGVFTVFAFVLIAWTFLPDARKFMAKRLEKSIGLPIPDELRPLVGRQAARRSRFTLVGLILAPWAVLPFIWTIESAESTGISTTMVWLIVGTGLAGGAIGAAVGSLSRPIRLDKDAVRYARPEAVTLGDYIDPLMRRSMWVVVGLATLLYLTSVVVSTTGIAPIALLPPTTFGGVLVALAIASLTFFEIAGRRMVGRAQPTGSAPELVWGDAMRSANLNGLWMAPVTVGFYALVAGSVDFMIGIHDTISMTVALVTVNVVGWLAIVAALFFGIKAITSRPQQYFLRQLWPQYVDFGTTAAAKQ